MSSISNISNTNNIDYSSLFETSSSSSSSGSSLYTDWASIKNGSYAKIAKAYYSQDSSSSVDKEEAKTTIKQNTLLKSNATGVKSSLSALESSSLYEKVDKKDENGNSTKDYNYDKIYKALKEFADSYNSVVETADDSDNTGVLRNAASMTSVTTANQNLLSKIGITIKEDNTLSVDEDAVKEANINDIKSLFIGSGSYGSQVDAKVSEIVNKVNAENNKLSNYTSTGSYNTSESVGQIYDGTY